MIKITESPRDGLQGMMKFIPTKNKIEYLNILMDVGFDTIDFGSFVSPKSIPQMRDTSLIVDKLITTDTKLLSIIVNKRGAIDASKFEKIDYFGYPFSISDIFLKRNTNNDINTSFNVSLDILNITKKYNKELVVYFSMGFGNPYGDEWSIELLDKYIDKFNKYNIKNIVISDTIGISTPEQIFNVFKFFITKYKNIEFGLHLHSIGPIHNKLLAAYEAGVRNFDTVVGGLGGCPAALTGGKLISNLETNKFITFCDDEHIDIDVDLKKLDIANDYIKKIL